MDTNSIVKLVISIALAALFQCCRGLCSPSQVSLTGGVALVYPDKDSIKTGDTLWFSASIPKQIKYQPGNSADSIVFDLSGASNVTTDIHIGALKGFSLQTGAIDSFDYVQIKGKVKNSSVAYGQSFTKTVWFTEENGAFVISFGLIPKHKGIYGLSIVDIYQAEKKCTHASVTIFQRSPDAHLYYLQDIYYGGQPLAKIDQDHAYCFKVY